MENESIVRTVYVVWMQAKQDDMDMRVVTIRATKSSADRFAESANKAARGWRYFVTDEQLIEE